jgi:integrase
MVRHRPRKPRIEPSTRLAIRLLLLTGARAGEACGASRGEIDAQAAQWIIPAARTKNGREHRLPLSAEGMSSIAEAAALGQGEWLLPAASAEGM